MRTKEIATQCIRRDRTGLREGAVSEGVSAETIRAVIFYDTDVVLALFVVLTVVVAIRFHGESKELGDNFIATDRHPYR